MARDLTIRPRQLKPGEATSLDLKISERLRVVDPMTQRALPVDGGAVVSNSYWVRRLRCGDVEEVQAAPRTRAKTSKPKE